MYTIKQAAEKTGASASSLRVWLSNEEERAKRFPGAVLRQPPADMPGIPFWLIPEEDIDNFEMGKRGPKLGSKRGKAKNN